MATSGTSTFTLTRDQIITTAFQACGIVDPDGGTPTATQLSVGANLLNIMVKDFQGHGLDLWTSTFAAVFLQPSQKSYQVGSGTSDHISAVSNITGIGQTLSNFSAGSFNVASTFTSIATGNIAGIVLDSGGIFWTTVSSVTVNAGSISIGLTASPAGSASAGNFFYIYSGSGLTRPLRIVDAYIRRLNQNDVPVEIITRAQYIKFGLKTSPGTPNQLYYDPQLGLGTLYVYPTDIVSSDVLYIDCQRPIQDFNTGTDNADFPSEWLGAIVYGLAVRLSVPYSVPMSKAQQISALYKESLSLAMSFDQEVGSIFIQPLNWQYMEINN
jgi:hypothetical protein